MTKTTQRLKRLTAIAAALPEAVVEPYHDHFVFKVRKKSFAYFLNNHHGDGVVGLCCKSTFDRQQELVFRDPVAYLGPSGWVTLRMDLKRADWDAATELLFAAYRLQAPKSLAAQVT